MVNLNPALLVPEYQNKGVAYVYEMKCGSSRNGYYTGYMVYVGGIGNPHTGPLATREEADALADRLNAGTK